MSLTSVGLRQSGRSLIPRGTSYQSSSPLALRRDAIERGNGLPYNNDNFPPHGSRPRLPTTATAARARAIRSEAQITYPRSGSPVSDDSPGSREPSPDDEYESNIGPVRSIKSHSRRQPPGHIPRPRNAFILYRSWYVKQDFLAGVENDHREISRIVGKIWGGLSESERKVWKEAAEREKKDHALKHPNYKYSPNSRRDGPPPPVRKTVARSTARARKSETPSSGRVNAIAEAYLAGSRRRSLSDRARQLDEKRKARELDVVAKRAALPLSIRVPPRTGQLPIDVDALSPPLTPNSAELSSSSPSSTAIATPSPQAEVENDSQWSLAACSAPFSGFALDSDTSYPHATYESYDSEIARSWPFRQGFSGAETLNTIMSYSNLTTEQGPLDDSNNDSTSYHQYSITSESDHTTTEPGFQPFDRIVQQEELGPGCLPADNFDLPYGHLASDHAIVGSYFEQLQQAGLVELAHPQSSASTASGEDLGLLAEWCAPESPVFVGDAQTSTASISSGAPTPPLTIESPAPMYPQRFGFFTSWSGDLDDLDAYKYAVGEVRAELDERDIAFELAESEGGRI